MADEMARYAASSLGPCAQALVACVTVTSRLIRGHQDIRILLYRSCLCEIISVRQCLIQKARRLRLVGMALKRSELGRGKAVR